LELLRKNPATTVPTILLRLKQKDVEWKKARLDLNNQWKDLLNKNYERSLDHSSYFFKLHDKKHYSARNLVADVKGIEVTNNQPMLPGTKEDLLKQADTAMYEAKRLGKNRICIDDKSVKKQRKNH